MSGRMNAVKAVRRLPIPALGLLLAVMGLLVNVLPASAVAAPPPRVVAALAATVINYGYDPAAQHVPPRSLIAPKFQASARGGRQVEVTSTGVERSTFRLPVLAAEGAAPLEQALTGVDDVLGGLARGCNAGVRTVGSEAELQSTFETLTRGGSPTEWTGYKGNVIQRSDGVQVGFRPGSASGGATIDVRMLDGTMQKIHIG